MKTRVCDICGRNNAAMFYKIKKRDLGLDDSGSYRLDVCRVCLVAFKNMAMEQRKKYKEIYDTNVALYHPNIKEPQ